MKKTIFFFSFLFLIQNTTVAQVIGNYNVAQGNQRYALQQQPQFHPIDKMGGTVVLDARGMKNVKPDGFLAIFNIKESGMTAEETEQAMNDRIRKFLASCRQIGIAPEDIYLDMISLVPVYEYETYKKLLSKKYVEVPSGFEMQQNIHIRYEKANDLAGIVSAAAQLGIYDLAGVTPYVENVDSVYRELRIRALEVIREKEAFYADAGLRLDTLFRNLGDSKSVVYPDQSYSTYQPAVTINRLDPETKENRVETVHKPVTYFYDPMRINNFDFVLEPMLFEPCLQFSYHLQVRYFVEPPKPKAKAKVEVKIEKEYYILSPGGELKKVKLEQ